VLLGSGATGQLPLGASPPAIFLPQPSFLYINNPTTTTLQANWASPGVGVVSYTLRYSLSGDFIWTNITGITGTSEVVTGLTPDTAYDFEVEAVYASGNSGFTSLVTASTIPSPIPIIDLIPVFPALPQGYPFKIAPGFETVEGTTKSLREMRTPQRTLPLWDFEILFEELRDQGQNETPFAPFAGFTQFEQLVQLWLMMYGQMGNFAFNCPYDNSRTMQAIGTGDGTTTTFTIVRTWGYGGVTFTEPVGLPNVITAVYLNGSELTSPFWSTDRNKIIFNTAPAAGVAITMTFSYYYVCRFVEDEQDFEEFSRGRWTLPSLKFQSVYWP
jgi:hypothetical protein